MVGSAKLTQSLKLTSTGTASLTVNSLTVDGAAFSLSGPKLPVTLLPGQASTFSVQLAPNTAGPVNGTLTINSNAAPVSKIMIGLSGTVTAFKAAINGLFCGSPVIVGTGTDSCVVVLTGPAAAGGFTVNVTTNNSALLVPTAFTVNAGDTKGAFTVARNAVGISSSASVIVSRESTSRSVVLGLVASSPNFSLAGGTYPNAVLLSMDDATPGTDIYYTTDGTVPAISSNKYSTPLSVSSNQVVKAIALGSASLPSSPTVANYVITGKAAPVPPGSSLVVPVADACQSPYDQFYGAEPGVYAFWPMCESGTNIDIYDYVGNWGLSPNHTSGQVLAWGAGNIVGGVPGPVPDNESAAQISTSATYRSNVGIPLNGNEGTIATWIQAQSTLSREHAMTFYTSAGKSLIALSTRLNGTTCFSAIYVDSTGTTNTAEQCGFNPNVWYRVVMTWSSGTLNLYVNGAFQVNTPVTGKLDNHAFNYRLFPGCCGYTKTMTLAKSLVANQAWSAAQIASDFSPSITAPPAGGVYITSTQLGTIHKDVLGYADDNSNLSNAAQITLLKSGLTAAGVTAVRYANGFGGITADLEDWQGGKACTGAVGSSRTAQNLATSNNIANFLPTIAQPLGLDVGYTVNYGTNAPYCDGGGDPIVSGANLVNYANSINHYGIKYWEIGNEVFSANTEPDFHPNPHTGSSYNAYEPAYYDAMKQQDPSIQIGVPIQGGNYNTQMLFDLPVLANAKYDALVFHNYPIRNPVSDGATLYRDRVSTDLYKTRGALLTLQTELLSNGKEGDAIWVTEWDADMNGNKWTKQSMGAIMPLYAASELAEYMRAGVRYATWWAQSSIDLCSDSNYDSAGESAYSWWECGSAGLIYNGPNAAYGHEVLVGLKPGDLLPAARAFQLLSQSGFVVEGEKMLSVVADPSKTSWLQAYAATHGNAYAVLLINRDRDDSHVLPLEFAGMSMGTSMTQWTYGRAQYDLTRSGNWSAGPTQTQLGPWNGKANVTLPPWSISVVVFKR